MKTVFDSRGPFSERPVFSQSDIENICESELMKAELYPDKPEPIRIERFIEKRFSVSVEYADVPVGVLGYTIFGPAGVEGVVVSRSLDDSGTVVDRRRVHTTLAHEAGHGLLHGYLYGLAAMSDIFSISPTATDRRPRILCNAGASSWGEVQANMAMGSLLLPEGLVKDCIKMHLTGGQVLLAGARQAAIRATSDAFDVNPIVAKIRLDGLFGAAGA